MHIQYKIIILDTYILTTKYYGYGLAGGWDHAAHRWPWYTTVYSRAGDLTFFF